MTHPFGPTAYTPPPRHAGRAACLGDTPLGTEPLPSPLTLAAPPSMRYAELLATLTAAYARGVRRARVVVLPPGAAGAHPAR